MIDRRPFALLVGALLTACLAGCAGPVVSATPTPPAAPAAATPLPAPGATLDASAVPSTPVALDVAVIDPLGDASTAPVRSALDAYASANGGRTTVYSGESTDEAVAAAMAAVPDVVVGIGPEVAAAFDAASASNLEVQFVLLGTQLAEPTGNVVAVTWPGADQRAVYADVARSFDNAQDHAAEAVARGLAAAPAGYSGFVIALP